MAPAVFMNPAPIANPLPTREVRLKDEVEASSKAHTLPMNNKVTRKPSFSEVIEANKGKPSLSAPISLRLQRAAQARCSHSSDRGNKSVYPPVPAETSSSKQNGTRSGFIYPRKFREPCYRCNKLGHWLAECPAPIVCFGCGKEGTHIKDCNKLGRETITRGNRRSRSFLFHNHDSPGS